jgi:hypothetical protein
MVLEKNKLQFFLIIKPLWQSSAPPLPPFSARNETRKSMRHGEKQQQRNNKSKLNKFNFFNAKGL